MPTVQDLADVANAKADTLLQYASDTTNNTAAINNGVRALDAHAQIGFANLSQGLHALIELEKVSVALQDHNRKQNDTIICLIENSNELLCGITRKLTRQLALEEGILRASRRMEGIMERAHAGEAGDYDRHRALDAKIEECCPPEQPPPEPCPDACPKSNYRASTLKGQDWLPLPVPRRDGPAGSKSAAE